MPGASYAAHQSVSTCAPSRFACALIRFEPPTPEKSLPPTETWKCAAQFKRSSGKGEMPPRGRGKAKVTAERPPDSSDEEEVEAEVQQARRERQPKKLFSKQAIYNAVLGSGAQTVRGNVPGLVGPEDVQRDWAVWLEETPEQLEDVPASYRPLPLAMPMKCVPADQERSAPQDVADQVELLTYQNPDGGAGVSRSTHESMRHARQRLCTKA